MEDDIKAERKAWALITALRRNDLDGTITVMKKLMAMKQLKPEQFYALRLLQDKPSSLEDQIQALGIEIKLAPGPPAE